MCFVLSGFAALLYETAWTRELGFLFGSSELAVAAVLGAYMGGLAVGAAAAARLAPRVKRPVLVYGVLELAIAVSALLLPLALQGVTALYVTIFGGAPAPPPTGQFFATVFQFGAAFLLLLVPTSCMGATLPLLARYCVEDDSQVGPRIGTLYATNVVGAIAGVTLAGFVLLPEIGLRRTVWVGAATNALVFVFAAVLARSAAASGAKIPDARRADFSFVLPVICLSGATSFAYEILWMRLLSHLLGGSMYAFTTMLGTFLTGIALGGAIASPLARTRRSAGLGLVISQLLVGGAALGAFFFAGRLPALANSIGAMGPDALVGAALLSALVMMPMATAIGASFPFAIRLAAGGPDEAASASARVTAWNTVGSIIGSLGTALFFLPALAFQGTALLGASVNFLLAGAAAWLTGRRLLAGVAVVALVAGWVWPPKPPWTLLRTSALATRARPDNSSMYFFKVGRSSTVLLAQRPSGYRLFTNGLPESIIQAPGRPPRPASAAEWMSLLPTALRPDAKRMAVVGLGGGVVLEPVPSAIEQIDVIELEEEVVQANRVAARLRAKDPLADPRITIYVNDARGALALSEQRYDAIVAQASHPWTAGASNLYTREFFEIVANRLDEGGVFVQWMGTSFVDEPLLKSLVASLLDVFEHVNIVLPARGSMLFAASDQPFDWAASGEEVLRRYGDEYGEWGIFHVEDFVALQTLDDAGVAGFIDGAPLSTDDHNLMASRSARVDASTALDKARFRKVIAAYDDDGRYDAHIRPAQLVRSLTRISRTEKARDYAESLPPADRELALGWIEYAATKPRAAEAHFREAQALGADAGEVEAGLTLTARDPRDEGFSGKAGVVAQARFAAAARDAATLEALESSLAKVPPEDPLYVAALRYRAEWRLLHLNDLERAEEALELIDRALARSSGRFLLSQRRRALQVTRGEEDVPAELIEIPETD